MVAPTESALQNVRAEWVAESTPGTPPSNPSWNRFSDYIASAPGWSGDAAVTAGRALGNGDIEDHFRGSESHELSLSWWMQRFFVDGSNNANDPVGELIEHDYQSAMNSHTVVVRRDVGDGGNDGAGFREYVVGVGCRPTSATIPGDPAQGESITVEATYTCERVRSYVIHQPSSSTTLEVSSSSSNDTTQTVTIENEGASTTDTFDLNGTTAVTGNSASSFSDIDAIYVDAETEGDISVTDGSGTTILENDLTGTNTDGVEGDRGVPTLGTGSHASAIGTDPADYNFLGTSATLGGGDFALSESDERIHALDCTIEMDVATDAKQGSRRMAIDVGNRTATAEVDVAGPYESAKQNMEYFEQASGDIVYSFPDSDDLTLKNATRSDTDDVEKTAGDANVIYGVTFEAHGDAAITATNG